MTLPRTSPDRLYELLPAVHRIADAQNGSQLRALLALVNQQADELRDDIRGLWDDLFIETSDRWVVPYIGDLVGNVPLHDADMLAAAATAMSIFPDLRGPDLAARNPIRLRADVARTIHYRRRKGTPLMLEELAGDVTGWGARVVEFFQLLDWTQYLEHLRPERVDCPDLRSIDRSGRIGGPWDDAAHTVDVRAINEWDGWYGLRNLGFFLWRLAAARRTDVMPRAIGGTGWRYTFSPLGQDAALWSAGIGPRTGAGRATELSIQDAIRPAAFSDALDALPKAGVTVASDWYGPPPPPGWDGPPGPAAYLVVTAAGAVVPASHIRCLNLGAWQTFPQPNGTFIGIDVARGRLIRGHGYNGKDLLVSFCEGVSGDYGGGEYDRRKWQSTIPLRIPLSGGGTALVAALSALTAADTVLEIRDSLTYSLPATVNLAAGQHLVIEARSDADVPARPHLRRQGGQLTVDSAGPDARLTLNGLLIEAGIRVRGNLRSLRVLHSTLVPGRSVAQELTTPPTGPSLRVVGTGANGKINTKLEVQIAFSIVGALRIPSHVTGLWLLDSLVDGIVKAGGPTGDAISDGVAAPNTSGPPAYIERTTILGRSHLFSLEMGSETIFGDVVLVERRHVGCARYSFIPVGSRVPQQYRCQPALEVAREIEQRARDAKAAGITLPSGWETLLEAQVETWLVPGFESVRYGDAAYAQLRRTAPVQIRTGAEDGSEMGVWRLLEQPHREANLRLRLEEYLPVGLDAGLMTVT